MEKCPIIFFGPKLCQACNKQGIEIYDRFDNPLGYSSLLRDKNSTGLRSIDRKAIYSMKCSYCGKQYDIHWVDNFPYPAMRDISVTQQFIKEFKGGEQSLCVRS